jgi:hypothetical protein
MLLVECKLVLRYVKRQRTDKSAEILFVLPSGYIRSAKRWASNFVSTTTSPM